MFHSLKIFLVLWVIILCTPPLLALQAQHPTQNKHQIQFTSGVLLSTGNESPFWIRANNSQRISSVPHSAWQRVFFQKKFDRNKNFDWEYGLDVIGRLGEGTSGDFTQAYVAAKNKYFNLFIGRKEERLGVIDSTLSIGPLVNGNNAVPIPKIAISTNGWLNVPFTKGWVQFNGYYSHGWFEKNRFMQNAFLHQKYFYVKLGTKSPVHVHAGIIANAQWGGTRADNGKKEPSSFDDYLRIITGRKGGANATSFDQINALGNHLGNWDLGATVHLGGWQLTQYWQFLWEDGSGLAVKNWRDGMMGISIKKKDKASWFQGLNVEIIRTNDQNATKCCQNGLPYLEPDAFFNNSGYRSGWSYRNVVIGSPVFLLEKPNNPFGTTRINNMINAVNLGVEGAFLQSKVTYTFNYVYFKNQGMYQQHFAKIFKLHSAIFTGNYKIDAKRSLRLQLSLDTGNKIDNSFGAGIAYRHKLFGN